MVQVVVEQEHNLEETEIHLLLVQHKVKAVETQVEVILLAVAVAERTRRRSRAQPVTRANISETI